MSEKPQQPQAHDCWPCACVKRYRNSHLKSIRLNHPTVKRCPVCKAERPQLLFNEG